MLETGRTSEKFDFQVVLNATLVTLSPLSKSCFVIRASFRHICQFMSLQRVMSKHYTLSGGFKVNSNRMWSGSDEHEAFMLRKVVPEQGISKDFAENLLPFLSTKDLDVSWCVNVILKETHIVSVGRQI